MRYLITVSSLTPGSGLSRYVFSLCELLARDNELYVLTTHDSGDTSYERAELDKINTDIKLTSLGSKSKLSKYLSTIKIVRRLQPDIIVNNYNAVVQYILPFISRKIKVIHVLHNDTSDFYRIGAINSRYMTGWIAPTESIANHFNNYTHEAHREQVAVIPHGVRATVLKPQNSKRHTFNIVFAGVLYEHKGVKILPPIIKTLMGRNVDLEFTIVGGGILSDWLHEQFANEIKAGKVKMTGVVDHDEVYRIMSDADVFLYPTHLDAFGLVIAEAMMNGAVPVVTHLEGITDNLINNEKNGFLLKKDDVQSFVNNVYNLYQDRDKLVSMRQATHRKACNIFSIEVMKSNYLNYFKTV